MGRAGMGPYDTTKAAVLGFTRALAVEEAPHGILVNVVCPGGTITPYHIQRAESRGVSETALRAQRLNDNLLGRWAELREVAHPILFLASDDSSFVTGTTLMVDAGRSIL
jgi:meso-butanediol dehydrogenase/(S,S)-butanediol dehydrogenase/diacetyl reductase